MADHLVFGKTSIDRASAKAMGEAAFKAAYKGKLDIDISEAWRLVNADQGKGKSMTSTDGNIPPRKKPGEQSESSKEPTETEKK